MTPAQIAKRNTMRIVLAFAAVYVLWGSTYLFIKYAIETIPPFTLGATRYIISGAILYGIARWRGAAHPSRVESGFAVLAGVLMLGVGNGGVIWAEQSVPSGTVALIVSSVPIWIAVLDWARPRGAQPRKTMILGLLLGFVGMVILVGPKAIIGESHLDEAGVAVLVIGSVAWSLGSLVTRYSKHTGSPIMMASVQQGGAAAAFLIVSLLSGELMMVKWSAVTTRSWISLGYLVIAGGVVAYSAYVYLLSTVSAAKAATYAFVNPIIAVVLGWLFANEPLGMRTIVAAGVILGGVAIITSSQASAKSPTGEHPLPTPSPERSERTAA